MLPGLSTLASHLSDFQSLSGFQVCGTFYLQKYEICARGHPLSLLTWEPGISWGATRTGTESRTRQKKQPGVTQELGTERGKAVSLPVSLRRMGHAVGYPRVPGCLSH